VFSFSDVEGDLNGKVVTCSAVEDFFYIFDEFELLSWDEEVIELVFFFCCWIYPSIVAAVILKICGCCSKVKLA
jgi:hypothetical protein